jgi:hypothetical protein
MAKGWVGSGLLMCLCWSLPAQPTPPPERPEPVSMECAKAYPFVEGHAPSESIVDPATHAALCNGLVLPTSLVAYYVELDSWKNVAVVEMEQLEAQQPTMLERWADRAQWLAIGVATGVVVYAVNDPS